MLEYVGRTMLISGAILIICVLKLRNHGDKSKQCWGCFAGGEIIRIL